MWTHEETVETSATPALEVGTRFTLHGSGQGATTSTLIDVSPDAGFTDETVVDETRVVIRHLLLALPSGKTRIIYHSETGGPAAAKFGRMVTSDFVDVLASLKSLAERGQPTRNDAAGAKSRFGPDRVITPYSIRADR